MAYFGDVKAGQAAASPTVNACRSGLDSGVDIAGAAAGAAFRIAPITGAISGAISTARNIGKQLIAGHLDRAVGELAAGAADTAVSIVAGGIAGSAAKESVRQGVGVVAGEQNMPEQSDLRRLAGDVSCRFSKNSVILASQVPAPPQKPGKPEVTKETKVDSGSSKIPNKWQTKYINIPLH